MIPDIFDIENGHLVINTNCLLLPELKAIHDKYKDPIPAFSFLHYLYYPKGPYCNVPEEDKEEILLQDFPGEYSLEDPEMINAMNKFDLLCISPSYRYYLDTKCLMEKLAKYGRDNPITTGRDGNQSAMNMQVKNAGKTFIDFIAFEKLVQEEIDEYKSRVRGNKNLGYDQGSANKDK